MLVGTDDVLDTMQQNPCGLSNILLQTHHPIENAGIFILERRNNVVVLLLELELRLPSYREVCRT